MFDKAKLPLGILVGAALLLGSACTRIRDHKGYIVDQALLETIAPGIDNRESVERTLGRPSFVGNFSDDSWYYVSQDTRQLAFSTPKPVKQTVLAVRFDAQGNVVAVDKGGLEKVANIRPDGSETPTLGRERGFFRELFGNIGRVGAVSQGGGSADNPN